MEGINKRGVIISGGDITDFFEFCKGDIVVCADRGYEYAASAGITPCAVIGDFDSIAVPVTEGIEQIKHPAEKDETDTELALLYLADKGIREVAIIGALGGRCDHSLANIMLLKKAADRGIKAYIEDENTLVYLVNDEEDLSERESRYVSVFPVLGEAHGVTLTGMKYPLKNAFLPAGSIMGISNEKISTAAKISVKTGTLLVIEIKK